MPFFRFYACSFQSHSNCSAGCELWWQTELCRRVVGWWNWKNLKPKRNEISMKNGKECYLSISHIDMVWPRNAGSASNMTSCWSETTSRHQRIPWEEPGAEGTTLDAAEARQQQSKRHWSGGCGFLRISFCLPTLGRPWRHESWNVSENGWQRAIWCIMVGVGVTKSCNSLPNKHGNGHSRRGYSSLKNWIIPSWYRLLQWAKQLLSHLWPARRWL